MNLTLLLAAFVVCVGAIILAWTWRSTIRIDEYQSRKVPLPSAGRIGAR
mgnify:CR=1 FL=1